MFWGVTIEHGKIYSQLAERSFHLSMAALGFDDISADPVSVVVEVDKAQYVLCTLQAGKLPQQALDHNFTEGEEVKFFLEGGKGQVHLTGYLFETPREIGFDELLPMTDTEESGSSAEEDDDSEGDSSVSSTEAAPGELANVADLNSDDDEDEDWTPKKFRRKKGKRTAKDEKETTLAPDLIVLGDDYDSEDDEDWVPGKSPEQAISNRTSNENGDDIADKQSEDIQDDEYSKTDESEMSTSAEDHEESDISLSDCKYLPDMTSDGEANWRKFLTGELSCDSGSNSDKNWSPLGRDQTKKKKRRHKANSKIGSRKTKAGEKTNTEETKEEKDAFSEGD